MSEWEITMAGMITLCGTLLGFMTAFVGFFFFDLSFVSAFAIWAFSGPLSAAFALLAPASPPAENAPAGAQALSNMQTEAA